MPIENLTDEALQRLRDSKSEFEASTRGQGTATGAKWATARARYEELKRLAESDLFTAGRLDSAEQAAFNAAVAARGRNLKSDVKFWTNALGPETDLDMLAQPEFVKGFVEGARDVWEAAKRKL
jgi:hypothetical protein